MRRAPLALVIALVALAAGLVAAGGIATAARSAQPPPGATASGQAALVTIVGREGGSSPAVTAPPTGSGSGSFAFPEDGSIARVGASTVNTTAQPGVSAGAQAVVELLAVSLFGGDVTAESIRLRAGAAAGAAGASADTSSATVTGLVVLGQPVAVTTGTQVAVADWGTLEVATISSSVGKGAERWAESTVVGLRLQLVSEHAGMPAGTEVTIGRAFAQASVPKATSPAATPKPTPPKAATPRKPAPNAPREPGGSIPGAPSQLVRPAPEVQARLSQGGYVFPIFGPAAFGDTFGAYRGDVSGKWHHGEDIVAPLGTPLLAVADGTLFSVGWNDVGGWRLWLRDDAGNEFYYAHLSAFSPLARDGQRVRAGDVVGFLGKSGDAEHSIPHLHFEIHPVDLLYLGYDGAVAPYPYLVAWQRAQDISFADGRTYAGAAPGLPLPGAQAGAVLLEASDISRTSGLVPGALERAVASDASRPSVGSKSP